MKRLFIPVLSVLFFVPFHAVGEDTSSDGGPDGGKDRPPSYWDTHRQDIRRIWPDRADSDCIGNPKTPQCAVETDLACWTRDQRALCELVEPEEDIRRFFDKRGGIEKPLVSEYIIDIVRYDLDTAVVGTQERSCFVEEFPCEGEFVFPCGYRLDLTDGKWVVISRACSDPADMDEYWE